MKCFIRSNNNEDEVPNCVGEKDATPQGDFCYQPDEALSLTTQNHLGEFINICTVEKPCFECQGSACGLSALVLGCLLYRANKAFPTPSFLDCDRDSHCYGPLRCFQRSSANPMDPVPGCQGGGVRGKSTYCRM
jgi:hypothetical protein